MRSEKEVIEKKTGLITNHSEITDSKEKRKVRRQVRPKKVALPKEVGQEG